MLIGLTDDGEKEHMPEYYEENISMISEKDKIAHFPKKIPEGAKNVETYVETVSFFGSDYAILKFDTDREYIEKELKKYKFVSKKPANEGNYPIYTFSNCKTTDIDDFIYYMIGSRDSEKAGGRRRYSYGIGVNKDYTQIIYYYINPD